MKRRTKQEYEDYLNSLGTPKGYKPVKKFGAWLRKNDPIQFAVGYNEFTREHWGK